MRGLTIVVAEATATRFRTTLNLALAAAAFGARVRLFLDGAAVAMVRAPVADEQDEAYAAAGLPGLAALVEEALDAGVRLILCQSGLALTDTTTADYDARMDYAGMVSVIAGLGDDRLVIA